MTRALLDVSDLRVVYDRAILLNGVSLSVGADELVGLVGPNGAGKSTLLRAISALVAWEKTALRGTRGQITLEGRIAFDGERIDTLAAHEIVRRGLVHCPERRRPFRELTVLENLHAGAYLSTSAAERRRTSTGCTRSSRASSSAAARWRARCPAASSRCWRSAAR